MNGRDTIHRKMLATAGAAVLLVSTPVMIHAQDDPNQALKDQKARLDLQAEIAKARADVAQARIDALRLPTFTGARTLGTGAGAIEASMLSATAVARAADLIAARLAPSAQPAGAYSGNYILLAGDERLDFAQVGMLLAQMDAIKQLFDRVPDVPVRPAGPRSGTRFYSRQLPDSGQFAEMAFSPALVTGAISAAAGLLRSDVEINSVDTTAISDDMLVAAVASRVGDRAILQSALIGVVEPCASGASADDICLPPLPRLPRTQDEWQAGRLLHRFEWLAQWRNATNSAIDRIPAQNQTAAEQHYLAVANEAVARFDTFFTAVTTPGDDGTVPIARAAQLDILRRRAARVVRIYVSQHSGSVIKTTNLLTTLGADPIRVSGALLVRYDILDPGRGTARSVSLTCQTALVRLSSVQRWDWRGRQGPVRAECQEH